MIQNKQPWKISESACPREKHFCHVCDVGLDLVRGDIRLWMCSGWILSDDFTPATIDSRDVHSMSIACLVLESHIYRAGLSLVWGCQSNIGMCMGNPGPDGGQASDQP